MASHLCRLLFHQCERIFVFILIVERDYQLPLTLDADATDKADYNAPIYFSQLVKSLKMFHLTQVLGAAVQSIFKLLVQ